MKKWIFFLSLVLISYTPQNNAAVNVKTASFLEEVTDWASSDESFQIKRRYNSRGLHRGLLGFGWCSTLERRLEISTDRRTVRLRACWDHRNDLFTRRERAPDGAWLYTRSGTNEVILFRDQEFHFVKGEISAAGAAAREIFDSSGRWIGSRSKAGELHILYGEGPLPRQIRWNKETISLHADNGGLRLGQLTTGREKVRYIYGGLDLERVESARGVTSYAYDSFHNLSEIFETSGRRISVVYDAPSDRVVRVLNGECVEGYSYQTEAQRFLVSVMSQCAALPPALVRYLFHRLGNEDLRLERFELERGVWGFGVVYRADGEWRESFIRDSSRVRKMRTDGTGQFLSAQGSSSLSPATILARMQFQRE